ncbi:MAG: hypothetical protein ACXWNP_17570 [Vulcanimicrobiaceae bacterium]
MSNALPALLAVLSGLSGSRNREALTEIDTALSRIGAQQCGTRISTLVAP